MASHNLEELDVSQQNDDDSVKNKKSTNLIVNYIPEDMTQEELCSLFAPFGNFRNCKLMKDYITMQNLGFAFINYEQPESAKRALIAINGLRVQNKILKVSYARPSCDAIKNANVYVTGLPKHMTKEDLEALFRPYGHIISVNRLYDNNFAETGENASVTSRGTGFVRFDQRIEAERAIIELNGSIPSKCATPITVKFAGRRLRSANASSPVPASHIDADQVVESMYYPTTGDFPPSNVINTLGWRIFVYNLVPEITENDLWRLFGPFGAIKSVTVIYNNETNVCKGYGFITMLHYNEAVNAITSLNGRKFFGRVLQVRFKNER